MTKLLQEAIEHVKSLPAAEQDKLAEVLLSYPSSDLQLSEEQQAEVRARLTNPAPVTIPFDEVFRRLQA